MLPFCLITATLVVEPDSILSLSKEERKEEKMKNAPVVGF